MYSQRFLLRTNPDGTRQASWRMWLLVWLLPAGFAAAALGLVLEVFYVRAATVETTGRVVKVYKWENDNPFDSSPHVYGIVVSYKWSDGAPTRASAGVSHGDWNFPIGTELAIRYDPKEKTDIVVAGPTELLVAKVIAVIALLSLLPSLVGDWLVRRWLRGGTAGKELRA